MTTTDEIRPELVNRMAYAAKRLADVSEPGYVDQLIGTLGADPMVSQAAEPDAAQLAETNV